MLIFQTSNGGKWSEEKANSVSPKEKNIGEKERKEEGRKGKKGNLQQGVQIDAKNLKVGLDAHFIHLSGPKFTVKKDSQIYV